MSRLDEKLTLRPGTVGYVVAARSGPFSYLPRELLGYAVVHSRASYRMHKKLGAPHYDADPSTPKRLRFGSFLLNFERGSLLCDCKRLGDFRCDLVLHIKEVGDWFVEAGRPKYPTITIYKLRGHPDPVVRASDTAFDLISRRKLVSDLFQGRQRSTRKNLEQSF